MLCHTHKKINNLFTQFRKELLPDVIKNWENLSNDQQQSLGIVNEFFCALPFLLRLEDQAEACLKVWENITFKRQNFGSVLHGGYSNGESGTLRLIRTVCKSVQRRGCEKSGRMVERKITQLTIYHFLGNRFNILFLHSAGVYFLFDHLLTFLIKLS